MVTTLVIALLVGCGHADKPDPSPATASPPMTGEPRILQAWTGDYPVAMLDRLPAKQRENGVGYIGSGDIFKNVWNALKPDATMPDVDFNINLVLFVRNTQFFNRVSIGKVMVQDGVAEVLAMETMSAMPIEDNVAMALAVIPRAGITGIRTGTTILPVD
jgi:hypothetical protein